MGSKNEWRAILDLVARIEATVTDCCGCRYGRAGPDIAIVADPAWRKRETPGLNAIAKTDSHRGLLVHSDTYCPRGAAKFIGRVQGVGSCLRRRDNHACAPHGANLRRHDEIRS